MRLRYLPIAALGSLLCLPAAPLAAQQLPGYSPAASARERALEADAISRPDTADARKHSLALGSTVHVAGTPAQARTRDYVIGQMKSWGLPTRVRTYSVFLPHATSVHVWRVRPDPEELSLREPAVTGDSFSGGDQYPTVNGSSAAGDVTAPVVYVNYGLIEDYAKLDSLGVSVKGKIAVARYGRSFRGIKAREAEKHGAAALLIYSDPEDDGYDRGDVYPEGPMRPSLGVQRGSVENEDGDPTTPGYPSTPGAKRVDPDSVIPHIPVVPLSYGNAAKLLEGLRGTDIPQAWQGGLPFRYHVGPGPVVARVQVTTDMATKPYKDIWDTFGIVRGSEFPDEVVVIGGHRDAWGPGTDDNVSGSVSVMEIARSIAEQVKAGKRPRRTILFATWDAEEWGLVGSVEYVEDDSLRLQKGGVAYLNEDMIASGPRFGGGGSPSLRAVLRSAAEEVPAPDTAGSLWDAWRAQAKVAAGENPRMGAPGGGSDYAGFYNHLGIPILEWGFGGAQGIDHSAYDDPAWMQRFGDPGYRHHVAASQLGAAVVLRLANADVLPYDYAEYANDDARLPARPGQRLPGARLEARHGGPLGRHRPHGSAGEDVRVGARRGAGRTGPPEEGAGAHQRGPDAGRARPDPARGPRRALLVPEPHLRRRRGQRVRDHDLPVREGSRAGEGRGADRTGADRPGGSLRPGDRGAEGRGDGTPGQLRERRTSPAPGAGHRFDQGDR